MTLLRLTNQRTHISFINLIRGSFECAIVERVSHGEKCKLQTFIVSTLFMSQKQKSIRKKLIRGNLMWGSVGEVRSAYLFKSLNAVIAKEK